MTALVSSALRTQTAPTWRSVSALHRNIDGSNLRGLDVAEETPLAIQYNGVAHVVMMGTPLDLEDFALGFSIAEGIVRHVRDLKATAIRQRDDGITVDIALAPDALHRFLARRRVRSLRGHTSCGICGVEDLTQLAPDPQPRRVARPRIEHAALQGALDRLRGLQPLSSRTHGAQDRKSTRL